MFQSTHPHGVRLIESILKAFNLGFNPRTHTGCDAACRNLMTKVYVSIHAPTRGATTANYAANGIVQGFNPRTHTGCDGLIAYQPLNGHSFNPRTHTGCDFITISIVSRNGSFNPRTHTGCDNSCKIWLVLSRVSIHAPTRGATFVTVLILKSEEFQSTHPHGVRHQPFSSFRTKRVSIHAPTRGAT